MGPLTLGDPDMGLRGGSDAHLRSRPRVPGPVRSRGRSGGRPVAPPGDLGISLPGDLGIPSPDDLEIASSRDLPGGDSGSSRRLAVHCARRGGMGNRRRRRGSPLGGRLGSGGCLGSRGCRVPTRGCGPCPTRRRYPSHTGHTGHPGHSGWGRRRSRGRERRGRRLGYRMSRGPGRRGRCRATLPGAGHG